MSTHPDPGRTGATGPARHRGTSPSMPPETTNGAGNVLQFPTGPTGQTGATGAPFTGMTGPTAAGFNGADDGVTAKCPTGSRPNTGQTIGAGLSDVAAFMACVVPWPGPGPGYVNLHWKTPHLGKNGKPIWGGKPFKSLKPFMDMTQWGASKPSIMQDIYFCLSTQSSVSTTKAGKLRAMRSAATALVLKAIWLDIDVKADKGYATLEDALRAVSKFYQEANLPLPSAFVFSGGGLHVYWISDVPLTVSDWRPYAEGLRGEASRLGLRFDEGVTTDAARVLRVPGTFNYKTMPPRACRIASLGRPHNFAVDLARLATIAPTKVTAAVTQGQPLVPFDLKAFEGWQVPAIMGGLNPLDSLADGLRVHDDRPLSPDAVIQNCPHIQEAMITHGAGYGQGLWMLDVLA